MDHKDFEKGAQTGDVKTGDAGFWWKQSEATDRANALVKAANILHQEAQERSQANLRHARLYGNFEILGFAVRDYARAVALPTNRISLNVVASCIDTLTAKIAKTRPRPSFQTSAGNFRQQQRARRLDKFVRGMFYETRVHERAVQVFLDACIFDIGALKTFFDGEGRLCFERAFPEELFVDDADGIYGQPRQILQRKLVAKEQLRALYPKHALEINALTPAENAYLRGFGDCVEVWEGWHLPSGKKAGDGKHVIAVQGAELFGEEWKRDYFPFAFLRFSKRPLGFWGQGLAERLSGIQIEINRLLRSISEQLRRKGRGRVFIRKGAVPPAHIRNAVADVLEIIGDPHAAVLVDNQNAIAPEEFMQLDRLYQRAYQEAGISELSAGAKKPSGLDAAVALREFNDIETERFAILGKGWEQLFLDATEIALDMLRTRKADGYKVVLPEKRSAAWVDWKDIDLPRDAYVMQMFPVSSLPQTPSHRLQRVGELKAGGYIDHATAQRLLDFPDIEAEISLATAAIDDVDSTLGGILDDDSPKYIPPDEMTNLPLLASRATAAYLRVKHTDDIEPERVRMLVRLIDQAKGLIQMAQEPPPAAAPAPAGMPPAGPAPLMTGGVEINNLAPAAPIAPMVPPVVMQ